MTELALVWSWSEPRLALLLPWSGPEPVLI